MARLLPVLLVIALVSATASASHASREARPYSVAKVQRAFHSQGLSLWRQHMFTPARYTRLASSHPLHVVVFRNEHEAARKVVIVLGSGPPKLRKCHGCVVIRLRAPRRAVRPWVQETHVGNVAVVYLESKALDSGVSAALDALGRS
ncbi:MAG: hypothetical protein WAL31_04570 [Gaiellaceae bacterium]